MAILAEIHPEGLQRGQVQLVEVRGHLGVQAGRENDIREELEGLMHDDKVGLDELGLAEVGVVEDRAWDQATKAPLRRARPRRRRGAGHDNITQLKQDEEHEHD